ncbi:MAG: tetratricopeptide repeat protein [Bacteroidetes bacterium]|nr:tetratricopeptide repeat protein [Bacteroidota bacterium]
MFEYYFLKQTTFVAEAFRENPLGTRVLIELNSPLKIAKGIEIISEAVLRFGFYPVTLKLNSLKPVDRQLDEISRNHADHKLLINLSGWEEFFAGFESEKAAADFLENAVGAFHVVPHALIFWVPTFAYDAFYKNSPSLLKLCWESLRIQKKFDFPPADSYKMKKKDSHKILEQKINILENQLAGLKGKEQDVFEFGNVLQTLANFYFEDGEFEKAFECYDQCSKMKGTNIFNQAEYFHRMGVIYLEWDRFDKSREKFEEAIGIRESLGDKMGLAQTFLQLGLLNFHLAKYAAAIDIWKNAVQLNAEMDNFNEKAFCLLNLGLTYMAIGNSGAAFSHFSDALDYMKKLENQPGIALVLGHIALFQAENKKYAEAIRFYMMSRHLAEKNVLSDLVSVIDLHLTILLEFLGNDEFLRLKDQIKKGIEKRESENHDLKSV